MQFRIAPLLAAACALGAAAFAQEAREKSDLRVLLVGHDPANPRVMFADLAVERTEELYRERTAAFEALLNEHFESVTVVHADDYRASMSDAVDVTLFDAQPRTLVEAVREQDPETGAWTYTPERLLPRDFSRPALMIGENSPRIGEGLGLKLDWL